MKTMIPRFLQCAALGLLFGMSGCAYLQSQPESETGQIRLPEPMPQTPPAADGIAQTDCAPMGSPAASMNYRLSGEQGTDDGRFVKVSAIGYGAPPKTYYPEPQRKLMALRAARVDAYRALAETINGLRVWGNSTVGDMTVERDRYRTFMDAYVRGATETARSNSIDGVYEVMLEVQVDTEQLRQALLNDCRQSTELPQQAAAVDVLPANSFYFSASEVTE